jgi:hypothetical protein
LTGKGSEAACAWCERAFTPRTTGGHAQRFCGAPCRRAFDAAGRRFIAEAIADGSLTVESLRNGQTGTRALLPAADSLPQISAAEKPTP